MATDFTNKYMQVFQTYDEFGEHSADYVKGEDHVAFLIEENEVIYWLYLEQVWRPLNVRTTTTGELEDGRTKVAVRLEYVEGGQKYTSVPNIPDPERITSMSHFLEDYPDIEEVNVSGTVNLTDLSSAFAGSKIKDFSMLDTSNVTNIQALLMDVDNENGNYEITTNAETLWLDAFVYRAKFDTIVINALNAYSIHGHIANSNYTYIKRLICNYNSDKYNYVLTTSYYLDLADAPNLEYIKFPNLVIALYNTIENKILDIETNKLYIQTTEYTIKPHTLNINTNAINFAFYRISNLNSKLILQNKTSITAQTPNSISNYGFAFGYGIKGNYEVNTENASCLGNFWFTTPIVDDAFYAKYAQYNTPISIFQYKTTFEEVADVNISSKVDSDLLYINTFAVNFNTNELSIEIYNNINILYSNSPTYKNYKKFIIDNTNTASIDNCPMIIGYISYDNNGIIRDWLSASEGHISGYFKSDGSNVDLYHNNLFKNITFIGFEFYNIDSNVIDNSNINFDNSLKCIYLNNNSGFDIDYKNLIKNNKLEVTFVYDYDDKTINRICMLNNYNMNVDVYINYETNLSIYYNLASKESNPLNINADFILSIKLNGTNDSSIINTNLNLENLYVNCTDNGFLIKLFVETKYNNYYQYIKIDNIYGNANIELPYYDNYASIDYNYKHIDINKTRIANNTSSAMITIFEELDEESTINLITKLIDNADSSSKTIYMYRSQANIIGEENIAGAVAKNYEFAIIEN